MKEYIRVNRDSYDILHKEYNRRANARSIKKSDYEESAESLGGPVLSRAKLRFKTISVLEIGPGSGEMSSFFDKNGCRTMAVELSPKMAEIAKNRSPNTIIILGDILETEFCENQFEVIYAGAVIHLFPLKDAIELLKKIYNWIKPNGFLFINTTIHSVSDEGYEIKLDYDIKIKRFRRKWKENEFLTALLDSNFKILDRMFTNEKDRGKEWVAYICAKENKT
jgi:ubiquinone/menaquinone biosynthesis C-methylase UbiE